MSTLKADTIQSTSGGAATLTKQEAIKFLVNYDAVNQTTDSSRNQSSLTDNGTGDFTSAFTSSFSGAADKVFFGTVWNTENDGSGTVSDTRHMGIAQTGDHVNSASSVDFTARAGANASGNAANHDFSGNYAGIFGDLA